MVSPEDALDMSLDEVIKSSGQKVSKGKGKGKGKIGGAKPAKASAPSAEADAGVEPKSKKAGGDAKLDLSLDEVIEADYTSTKKWSKGPKAVGEGAAASEGKGKGKKADAGWAEGGGKWAASSSGSWKEAAAKPAWGVTANRWKDSAPAPSKWSQQEEAAAPKKWSQKAEPAGWKDWSEDKGGAAKAKSSWSSATWESAKPKADGGWKEKGSKDWSSGSGGNDWKPSWKAESQPAGRDSGKWPASRDSAPAAKPEWGASASKKRDRDWEDNGYGRGGDSWDQPPQKRAAPAPRSSGPRSIKVTNIPHDLETLDIQNAFEQEAGPIEKCVLRKGTAWITFERSSDAQRAVETFDRGELNGQLIDVVILRD